MARLCAARGKNPGCNFPPKTLIFAPTINRRILMQMINGYQ